MFDRRQFVAGLAGTTILAAPTIARARPSTGTCRRSGPTPIPHGERMVKFADEVKAATGGAVNITVKAGGQLGFKGPEHLRAVRDGLVRSPTSSTFSRLATSRSSAPRAFPSLSARSTNCAPITSTSARSSSGSCRTTTEELYMVPWPTQYLHLKVKADSLAGLSGQKVRCPDRGAQDMVNALGMTGVVIPGARRSPRGLGRRPGRVDLGRLRRRRQVLGVLKFIYPTNHVWSSQMVNVNLDSWNRLPANHRAAIEAVAKKLEPEFWATSVKADTDSLAAQAGWHGGRRHSRPDDGDMRRARPRWCRTTSSAFRPRRRRSRPISPK